jgi:DNA-directed RNA polymerase subunit RPC12/RpoP
MISENIKSEGATCVCPECKNIVDLSKFSQVTAGMIIECNHCGMTLLVKQIQEGSISTEIIDAGK